MQNQAKIVVRIGPDIFAVAQAKKTDPYWITPEIQCWLSGPLPIDLARILAGASNGGTSG